ncbi:hypothetical protein OROMI_031412 [Orobanche minor]
MILELQMWKLASLLGCLKTEDILVFKNPTLSATECFVVSFRIK